LRFAAPSAIICGICGRNHRFLCGLCALCGFLEAFEAHLETGRVV
jgi:hypothetical protein